MATLNLLISTTFINDINLNIGNGISHKGSLRILTDFTDNEVWDKIVWSSDNIYYDNMYKEYYFLSILYDIKEFFNKDEYSLSHVSNILKTLKVWDSV